MNMKDVEAIRSAIPAVSPSLQSICDTVHYPGDRAHSSFLYDFFLRTHQYRHIIFACDVFSLFKIVDMPGTGESTTSLVC